MIMFILAKKNEFNFFLHLTKNNITDIITVIKMNYKNTNIIKQNSAIALDISVLEIFINLSISTVIILGINLILSLIIIG